MIARALIVAAASAVAWSGSSVAWAQEGMAGPAEPGPVWQPYTPEWSEPELAEIADRITGTWRTSSAVESAAGDRTELILNIHPVPVEDLSDTLYMETFRADDLIEPARQVFAQLYRHTGAGEIRIRTFEIRTNALARGVYAGMGLAPRAFPLINKENLIATLDLAFTGTGDSLRARSPHEYPTGIGEAVEMSSAIEVTGDTLRTMDRGYGPDGRQVWGPPPGEAYEFERADGVFEVTDLGEGLIAIDFNEPEGAAFGEDDIMFANYTGWLRNAAVFDSSFQREQPLRVPYPPQLIEGWNRGLEGMTEGQVRKLVIPSDLAYGPQGRGSIPPDATLYFIIEVAGIDRGEDGAAGTDGGDGGG